VKRLQGTLVGVMVARLFLGEQLCGYRFMLKWASPDRVEYYDVNKDVVPIDLAVYLTVEAKQDLRLIDIGESLVTEDELRAGVQVRDISGAPRKLKQIVSLYKRFKSSLMEIDRARYLSEL